MSDEQSLFENPEMQHYFSSLPIMIQESIRQSGLKYDSLQQLQSFTENLTQKN